MEEILISLAKSSPIVAILIYVLYWLKTRLEKREEEISTLNEKLRESEKTALEAFSKITDVLKQMSMEQTISNKDVVTALNSLRELIKDNLMKK
jgi:hypothetical protein